MENLEHNGHESRITIMMQIIKLAPERNNNSDNNNDSARARAPARIIIMIMRKVGNYGGAQ